MRSYMVWFGISEPVICRHTLSDLDLSRRKIITDNKDHYDSVVGSDLLKGTDTDITFLEVGESTFKLTDDTVYIVTNDINNFSFSRHNVSVIDGKLTEVSGKGTYKQLVIKRTK